MVAAESAKPACIVFQAYTKMVFIFGGWVPFFAAAGDWHSTQRLRGLYCQLPPIAVAVLAARTRSAEGIPNQGGEICGFGRLMRRRDVVGRSSRGAMKMLRLSRAENGGEKLGHGSGGMELLRAA